VFWPLIGGFIGFLIVAVLIGWTIESSERRAARRR
jgi:biotin transporter BioY